MAALCTARNLFPSTCKVLERALTVSSQCSGLLKGEVEAMFYGVIPFDWRSARNHEFAFVPIATTREADRAIDLANVSCCCGRNIQVNFSQFQLRQMEDLGDVVPQISKEGQAQKVEGCPSCFDPATDGSWRALANQGVGPSVEVLQVGLLERARSSWDPWVVMVRQEDHVFAAAKALAGEMPVENAH